MRRPLGDKLARNHRVILIDRPGHGWSTRANPEDFTPAVQGRMIDEALANLGIDRAVFVVHSWAGALGARMALDYPERVAGLGDAGAGGLSVAGGVGWYNRAAHDPGDRPATCPYHHTPARSLPAEPGARSVFLPQGAMPDRFVRNFGNAIIAAAARISRQRPGSGDAEGRGQEQAPRYATIRAPVVVIAGDGADKTVSTSIHSRPFAATVPNAKLIVLPEVGHMVPQVAPDLVVAEIEAIIGRITQSKGSRRQLGKSGAGARREKGPG